MAKMIGFVAMLFTISGVSAPATDRPKNTSAPSMRLGEAARLGLDRMGRLPLVHAFAAALVDDAL